MIKRYVNKKILIVSDAWYPQINGVIKVFEYILKHLKELNYEIILIHPQMFKTIPLPTYPEIRLAIFSKKKIRKIIEDNDFNYIHIATEGPLGLATRNICIKKKLNFTTSFHSRFNDYIKLRINFFPSKLVNIFLRWSHNKANQVMTATDTIKTELESYGIKNVKIWPLGIDLNLFNKNLNLENNLNLKSPIFVYLGRIAIEKNLEEFLKLDLPGSKLMIGDGPDRKRLELKYKNKNTKFVGYKHGKEIVDLLSICDVFVFPSLTETFGLVIIEALACGLPVAAFNIQGPKDIITNKFDGFIGDNLKKNAIDCLKINRNNCRKTALKYSTLNSTKIFISNLVKIK